ncbi:hypothetical protein CHLRE_11g477550v5 [Chlamydomonas reinhardtii]|uniref:Uncharacterized protein n=1 Tax=Chlamydomonas reinhardtii TaxID=3055 RepID=A8J717_CHLRE|nr:uncharacterized protein CHLRE_11g477550v5 [Chlamydomonas reinhardtii]PNW76818.1 hypothetical protein CHLRE_11g477550v5 [Chlamydomonas reinhardtii]|eukprot:XP_001697358.1 predicted protein [Chlamydomonas reinhardtii]
MATAMQPFRAFSNPRSQAPRQQSRHLSCTVSCAQRSVPTTSPSHQQTISAGQVVHHDLGSAAVHRTSLGRHPVFMHISAASGPQPTQSYAAAGSLGEVSVLEQFGPLGGMSDYTKLISALTLVSCSALRPPATALLGLALLEEATQLPYDLISLE